MRLEIFLTTSENFFLVERDNAQTNHKENSQMMNNPQFLVNNRDGQDMPCVIILSNGEFEMMHTTVQCRFIKRVNVSEW